jgi:kynurenine formamidase
MNIIDITGSIENGMWNYEYPFPGFNLKKLPKVEWLKDDIFCEIFEGIHSQTGTYIETPAHFFGNDKCYLINDVPLEKLIGINCSILNINKPYDFSARTAITVEDLENCPGSSCIKENDAIIIGTGWGIHWLEPHYLSGSPYFTYDAMMWLISKKPYLLGSDFPRWENLENMQGFFPEFYKSNILMLAPCINIEKINAEKVKLTALPINIKGTSCVPCRAFVQF